MCQQRVRFLGVLCNEIKITNLKQHEQMNNDMIFQFTNSFVLIGWLLLFFAPKWRHSLFLVRAAVIIPLSLIYAGLVFTGLSEFDPSSFSTLDGVKALFADDSALVAGWVHYLAFDLFVGSYIVQRGIASQMPRWMYTLCLPFTFMFGPLGLLTFGIIQFVRRENI